MEWSHSTDNDFRTSGSWNLPRFAQLFSRTRSVLPWPHRLPLRCPFCFASCLTFWIPCPPSPRSPAAHSGDLLGSPSHTVSQLGASVCVGSLPARLFSALCRTNSFIVVTPCEALDLEVSTAHTPRPVAHRCGLHLADFLRSVVKSVWVFCCVPRHRTEHAHFRDEGGRGIQTNLGRLQEYNLRVMGTTRRDVHDPQFGQ